MKTRFVFVVRTRREAKKVIVQNQTTISLNIKLRKYTLRVKIVLKEKQVVKTVNVHSLSKHEQHSYEEN